MFYISFDNNYVHDVSRLKKLWIDKMIENRLIFVRVLSVLLIFNIDLIWKISVLSLQLQ